MRHPTTLHSGDDIWPTIRVLLFSQDDAFRFLVRQTFRKLKVRDVLSTSVSADATPMMAQAPDVGLVDLDGDVAAALAFLERVRTASAVMPVLVMARSGEKAGMDDALRLGIEGVVPKLMSGHELAHRVSTALKTPNRLPLPPAPKAKTAMVPPPRPAPRPLAAPTAGATGAPAASVESAALKGELAALTSRLGRTLGGGGTYGSDKTSRPAGWSDDDLAPQQAARLTETRGGKLAAEDIAPAKAASAPLELKAGDEAARRKAEEAKARWQAELAQTGHQSRTGSDVAGLDVTAIVAAHLEWLTSKGAQGKRATFQGMDLAGGDLSRAVLANATFREADLSDARLAESRLDGADFRYASLGAADLTGANLGVAQLRHADLRLANLQGAILRGADLSGARLRGAKLAGTDFGGAVLVGTDLREVDLAQVDNLTQGQVDKAECDMTTKLPPGVFRPRPKSEA